MPRRHEAIPKPAPETERAFRWHPAATAGGAGRGATLDPWRERDACGVGFVARASGARSHDILRMALTAVARLHGGSLTFDVSPEGGAVVRLSVRMV